MDSFCFSGVGHHSCCCLRTGTPSSRMETRIGKACSNEDINISHAKDCWLNFYPSPPRLVPADIMATCDPQVKLEVLWPQALSGPGECLQLDCLCGRSHSPSAEFAASLIQG